MTIKPVLKASKHESKSSDAQDSIQSSGTTGSSVLRPSHRGSVSLQQQKPESSSPQRDHLTTSGSGLPSTGHGSRRRRSPHKRIHKRDAASRVVLDTKSCKSPSGYQLSDQKPVSCAASPHAGLASPKSHGQSQANVSSLANPSSLGTGNNNNSVDESNTIQVPADESFSGYNSGDEHIGNKEAKLTVADWADRDKDFAKSLEEGRGFVLNEIAEDGACLFRSISLQIYGDQDMHEVIRNQTMDYIYKNREYFAQFVTEDITSYVLRKRNNHVHGNHIEIQAISEIYNRPVELYCYQMEPINIFNSDQMQNGYEPLRLSYQRGSHYNAILNPYKASVGVGLGLAGYSPNEPDRTQMHEAVRQSEDLEIEQTMFEDKLKTTDWEATNEAIEEQIARESYLQWCRDNMQQSKTSAAATSSNSTVTSSAECLGGAGLVPVGGGKSPKLLSDEDDSASFGSDSELGKGSAGKNDLASADTYACYTQQRHDRRRKRRRAVATPTAGPSNDANATKPLSPNASESSPSGKHSRVSAAPSCAGADDLPGTSSGQSTSSSPAKSCGVDAGQSPPKPALSFYHELLESSFSDDLSDLSQLTEAQMLQKALQMSRMDFVQQQHTLPDSP